MPKLHIGLRTVKTVAAVVIAMIVVDSYGATTSKLIFAMLGAMAAVQPTFKESLESCVTQIVGVLCGALIGVLLMQLPISHVVQSGIGIVVIITLYNALGIRFSPSLPCLIVVTLCTAADVRPFEYALGRIWDSAIGLGLGMLINTLIFPYDNSRRIRDTVKSLDREVIGFLEDMFDGDDIMPDMRSTAHSIDDIGRQLSIFGNQVFLIRRKQRKEKLETYRICAGKARQMLAQMEVLKRMDCLGHLSPETVQQLQDCGASILQSPAPPRTDMDIITNYQVQQILAIRQELLEILEEE